MEETWVYNNSIELFGAITGILYVFLEVRQNRWLWFVGIVTSAVYIWVFFKSKFYADMSLQGYYLVISVVGLYWWSRWDGEKGRREEGEKGRMLEVTRIRSRMALILSFVFAVLYSAMYMVLSRFTDSPVPGWDSFITSLSIVATWMLARKIYEHWYLWIVVNLVSAMLFATRGLYPTLVLYVVYCIMSFAGLYAWRKGAKVQRRKGARE
jgi:nicotinamide mononucleotide transporter